MTDTPKPKAKKVEIIESLRGFASIYIVIHHFLGFTSLKEVVPGWVHMPFRFGQEVVVLFFLMSGFVIFTSNQKIETTGFKKYFAKRFIRIYPVFILTLLLSFIVLMPNGEKLAKGDLTDLVGNLFMLQDTGNKPGAIVYPFLKNYPLWSLSYEWWFYMAFFPLMVFFNKIKATVKTPNIYFILLVSVVAWLAYLVAPNHILLIVSHLILWWAGIYIAQLYFGNKDITFRMLLPVYISFAVMTALSLIPIIPLLLHRTRGIDFNNYPVIDLRHFGSGLVILAVGNIMYNAKNINWERMISPMSKLAPISYALYCIHFPIILLKLPFITNAFVEFGVKLILTLALSYLLEIVIQPFFTALIKRDKLNPIPAAAP